MLHDAAIRKCDTDAEKIKAATLAFLHVAATANSSSSSVPSIRVKQKKSSQVKLRK
jgi:hypothetical protein